MKKSIKLISMLICLLMLAQVFAACVKQPQGDAESDTEAVTDEQTEAATESDTESESESESESETETDPAIVLGEVGTYTDVAQGADTKEISLLKNSYKIIYNAKATESLRANVITKLYSALYDSTGVLFQMKGDTVTPESKYEIVIGDTNREGGFRSSDFAYCDYGWACVDKKVYITGGSELAIALAVDKFVETYLDKENKTLDVPGEVSLRSYYSYPYANISIEGTDISEFKIAMKKAYSAEAAIIQEGFGRLTGVVLETVSVNPAEVLPEGKYIYVGIEENPDLKSSYKVSEGVLSFVSNGLEGGMNQLGRAVDNFFETYFEVESEAKTADIKNGSDGTFEIEFEYLQYVDKSYKDELDSEFDELVDDILGSASEWETGEGGSVFYVSSSTGDDRNDGTSPETPWKTLDKVSNASAITPGSVVLFKRGDEWNREIRLTTKAGVTYSAYGEGPKPVISKYAAADNAEDWIKVEGTEHVWVYNGEYASTFVPGYANDENLPGTYITSIDSNNTTIADSDANNDVGIIVFETADGRVGWGSKVTKYAERDVSLSTGTVPTGFGEVTRGAVAFTGGKDLAANFEFFHDPKESRVYLYWDEGNPGDYFDTIKLVLRGYLCAGSSDNVTIDNIAFKYVGCHAINTGEAKNFTVRNCEIGWIGGSIQIYAWGGRDYHTRFGEGIQNWGNCDGFYVYDNYFHQVYDGAVSSQFSRNQNVTSILMNDVLVSNNAFECNMGNFEFWMTMVEWQGNGNPNFKFSNFDCSENLIRRAGQGHGCSRRDVDHSSAAFNGSMGWPNPIIENCHLHNNKVWDARYDIMFGLVFHTEDSYNVHDNIFVKGYGERFGQLAKDFENRAQWDVKYYYYNDEDIDFLTESKAIGPNTFYFTYDKSASQQ